MEARPARLPDDPEDLVWIEDGPESGQAFPDPPPVPTKCSHCRGPLIVWHGTPVCENCDVVELPATDDWLREDDCGRGERGRGGHEPL